MDEVVIMMLPHEIAARRIIPSLRGLLAHTLLAMGLSQSKIAEILAISQPMVNKYLKKSKKEYLRLLEAENIDIGKITAAIDTLAHLALSLPSHEVAILLSSLVNSLLIESRVCKQLASLTKTEVCEKLFGVIKDPNIILMERVIELLKRINCISQLIPEVGSNIVYAPFNEPKPSLTIGLKGRILKTGSSIIIAGMPSYGGSKHTASVLIEVMKRDPTKRSVIVLAYNNNIINILSRRGLKILFAGPHYNKEELLDDIVRVLTTAEPKGPDILVDLGGHGVEPVIYLFADSPLKIIDILELLCKALSTSSQ